MVKTALTKNHIIRSITIYPFYYKISRAQHAKSFKLQRTVWFIRRRFAYCEHHICVIVFHFPLIAVQRNIRAERARKWKWKFIWGCLYMRSVFQGLWCRMQEPVACQSGSRWPDRDCNTRKHPLRCAMFLWVITLRIMRAIITSNLII